MLVFRVIFSKKDSEIYAIIAVIDHVGLCATILSAQASPRVGGIFIKKVTD